MAAAARCADVLLIFPGLEWNNERTTEGHMEEQDKKDQHRSSDEIALELTKFIATSTGYGRGPQAVGFAGKGVRTPEEQAEQLLGLFARCRKAVREE
jgi:hypothetical protein